MLIGAFGLRIVAYGVSSEAGADSFSFYDELIGKRKDSAMRPHMVVNSVKGVVAIRKGSWKYIEGVATAPLTEGQKKYFANELEEQLYNLDADFQETDNRIMDDQKVAEDLKATLEKIRTLGSERLNAAHP